MGPMVRYPMWKSWLSPFRRSQQKTLARGMAAAASVAQASSLAVAGHLAARLGIQRGRAWNRLLRNPRVDERLRLLGAGRRLRIALDGTEWHPDLWWPRAIPVQGAAFRKRPIFRSPNGWEHTFLRLLVHTLRETGRTAAFIGSRGSSFCGIRRPPGRRPQGLRRNPRGPALPPRAGGRPPAGQGRPGPRGLGPGAGGTRVGPTPSRTSWPWMTGAWASGIPRAAASAEFRTPQYLARFTLLPWTAVGQALGPPPLQAEGSPPLPAPGGHRACRVRLSVRFIQRHLPSPQLRVFAWLQTAEATS